MTSRKSDNPSRLIVGCGYLGQRVARRWIQSGSTVFATTRSAANADILSSENILPIIGDVTAAEGSPEILSDLPEVCIQTQWMAPDKNKVIIVWVILIMTIIQRIY